MQAKIGDFTVKAWKISKEIDEDWVKSAFDKHQIYWNTTSYELLIVPQFRSISAGKIGDYLVLQNDNYMIISKKRFKKDYVIVK